MYTIEELEALVNEFDAAPKLGEAVIIEGLTALERIDIARQLLDTMRALEAAQMRIEAAAAIGEDVAAQDFPLYYAYSDGANSMREQFRKALEIE